MSRIFWDTNLFIYLFEDKGDLTERVVALRERMIEREDTLFTSALTLGEILVKPLEVGDRALMQAYERTITANVTVLPFDEVAATMLATLRQDRSIQPADAIQLASAAAAGVDLFITNDGRLSRHSVSGIHFIQSLAVVAL